MSFTATCDSCGFSGSTYALNAHDCAHESYLHEAGNDGRCEDYPACGHSDGNTCSTEETGTMAFWQDMFSKYGNDAFDMDFN